MAPVKSKCTCCTESSQLSPLLPPPDIRQLTLPSLKAPLVLYLDNWLTVPSCPISLHRSRKNLHPAILSTFPQFNSVAQSSLTLCDPMIRSTPCLPVHHKLPDLVKLMPIELVMPSSHFILYCPLILLPPIPPGIRVFSNESVLHMRWPKYWSFSFSISPSNEYPGLISFRLD